MNRAISAVDTELIRSGLLLIGALQVTWPWTGSMHADKSLAITLTKGSYFAFIIRFNTTKKMDAGSMAFIEEPDIQRRVLHDWIGLQIIRKK